jgi:hypothetical protein
MWLLLLVAFEDLVDESDRRHLLELVMLVEEEEEQM